MLFFNDLLAKAEIDPKSVLIMRHRPTDLGLRRVLPWFASDKPEIFNAYQQAQLNSNVESALKNSSYLASFIGEIPKKAHFVGIYNVGETNYLSNKSYWKIPENIALRKHGMSKSALRDGILWFDLQITPIFSEWQGRLVIEWSGPERAWYRRAHKNKFRVDAILDVSTFNEEMPDWQVLTLSWTELQSLPRKWATALSQWRGIYMIFDNSDGKHYIGSAYGKDNILGRWQNYAASGHGGNKALKTRDPNNFMFSIIQRVSPDLEPEEVIQIEATWKTRLHSRDFGLNEN